MNGACPDIRLALPEDVDVGPEIDVSCNPDGTASVTIPIRVNNITSQFVNCRGQCGPGGVLEQGPTVGLTPGQVSEFSFTCRYNTPSAPTPFVEILDVNFQPFGCPNFQVPLDPLPACPRSVCPLVQSVQVQILDCTRDAEDGNQLKRRVIFTPSIYLPTEILNHIWSFGDGESAPSNGPPMQAEHLYQVPPLVPPELCLFPVNEDCDPECFDIPLSAFADFRLCECPEIASISVQFGGCERDASDGKQKRSVTFVPTLTGPSPSAYNWTFGDGSSDVGGGTPGSVSHLYEQVPPLPPRLCVQATAPCEETCREVPLSAFAQFEPCEGGGGGEAGGEGWGCFALRAVMTIAAILAIVAASLYLCIPAASSSLFLLALGLGFVATFVGVIWAFVCPKPCGWGLLLSWQTALGVGFILLCFTVCCPTFWAIGLGLVGLGVGLMFIWKSWCNMSNCGVLKELVIALSGVVLPLLGWLEAIPALGDCINTLVTGSLSTLAAAIAVAATNCDS